MASFFEMAKLKVVPGDANGNKEFLASTLEMADHFIFELGDKKGLVKAGGPIQIYYHLVCDVQASGNYGIKDIGEELEIGTLR